jgi:hypothetical protein
MSKDAFNKVRYLCLSNCINDEMLEKAMFRSCFANTVVNSVPEFDNLVIKG